MSDLNKDNYRNNVDKSILVIKDIRNSLKPTSIGYISIENVLKEIETYKKIAEFLAGGLKFWSKSEMSEEELLDWARKEVENGEENK